MTLLLVVTEPAAAGAPIAYGVAGARSHTDPAGTSMLVSYPSPVNAGELLIMQIITNGGAVTTPAGWTALYAETTLANPKGGVWYKIADGTETGTLTVTMASTTGNAIMHTFTGVNTTTPLDAGPTSVVNTLATSTESVIPELTTVTPGAMLFWANGINSGTARTNSTGTELFDFGSAGGTATKGGSAFWELIATPAATGTRTCSQVDASNVAVARANFGLMGAFRPATVISSVLPTAIASAEAFGTPVAIGPVTATPTAIASGEAFGTVAEHWEESYTFDDGTAQGWTPSTAGAGTLAISTAAAHDGTHGATSNVPAATVDKAGYTRTVPATKQAIIRGWWRVTTEGASGSNVPFARMFEGANRVADVYRENVAGTIWLRVTKAAGGANYWFTSTAYVLPLNTWVYVSFQWGLDGKPEVFINGTRYITQAQVPTDWLAATNIDTAWLGSQEQGNAGAWDIDTVEVLGRGYATGEARQHPILTGEQFGTTAAAAVITLQPSGIGSGEAFGAPVVSGAISLQPSGIASGEAFGSTAANLTLTSSPGGIASGEAFGTAVATQVSSNVLPTGIASAEAFGAPVESGTITLTASSIGTAEAFGTPAATAILTATPAGIGSGEAFGTTAAVNPGVVQPTGIGSAEAFGTPVSLISASVQPTGIASAEAFGAPVMGSNLPTAPTGIASAEAFGTPSTTVHAVLTASGIASAQALGTPAATVNSLLTAAAIGSAEAFGTPVMGGSYTATGTGIPSAETFGTHRNESMLTAVPTSFSDPDAFGTPSWVGLWVMQPAGIASGLAWGNPVNGTTISLQPSGIASGEAFGTAVEQGMLLVAPVTMASLEAFGTATESGMLTAVPSGVGSAFASGFPVLTVSLTAVAVGISDPNAYGTPAATVLAFIGRDLVLELAPSEHRWHVRANYGSRMELEPAASRFDTEEKPDRFEFAPAADRFNKEGGL